MVSFRPFTRYFSLLARYLKPQWGKVLLMSALLLISIGLQLYNPKVLGDFINATLQQGIGKGLVWLALLYLLVSFLNQGASVVSEYLCEKVAWTATNELRADLLAHVLTLDQTFHKQHTQGELLERIDGDVNDLSNFFSKFLVHMLFHLLLLLGMLVVLASIDWRLGASMGGYCLLVVVALTWMRRPTVARWMVARQASAEFFGFLGESLAATEDIRANGGMSYVWRHFYNRFYRWYATTSHAGWSGASPWIISQALFALGRVLGLVLGAYLWSIGLASPGTVYLIFVYSSLLMQPLDQVQWQLQSLNQSESCIRRIEGLFATRTAIQDGPGAKPAMGALSVTFEHVAFGYSADEPVLKDMTFHLPAGHVLGIVGRTGGGKTTITRLLFRMYDPQSGTIRLNEVPLTDMRLNELRQRISLITQDVQLFNTTVRDNLTFFRRDITDEHIRLVLEEIGLLPWYASLPQGLETMLGTGGEGLSAGEAQLLAFARVFLTKPDIVVLDEASSRLDPLTERLMGQAMGKLFANRTGIIIAHRLETLQHVDDILVIDNGEVLEAGSRAELAQNPGSHFARLLQHVDGAIYA
ncbi:ABC transporter related protein [Ktedonobacter racemifer DSM 44963]|uniref:ABC transporter related protein n=1 Tax=Ktedonobacter racemifer DSM 44963 TaxID=485913 RepID=D6U0M3_KTERA|nr:ABC transporter related protein [Ktedonobacter racemifer DSM 44963]